MYFKIIFLFYFIIINCTNIYIILPENLDTELVSNFINYLNTDISDDINIFTLNNDPDIIKEFIKDSTTNENFYIGYTPNLNWTEINEYLKEKNQLFFSTTHSTALDLCPDRIFFFNYNMHTILKCILLLLYLRFRLYYFRRI